MIKNEISNIKFKNLITRQVFMFKNKQVIDLEIFKKGKYYLKKSNWDSSITFLYTSIDNSIHNFYYQNPKKFRSSYKQYISKTEQKEHSLDAFDKLINEFDLNLLEQHKITISHLENKIINKKYVIIDGNHRLVIFMNRINNRFISKKYLYIK